MSPEHLALLMKREWQLSYVTPLYQFRHTQLKNYSRQLAAYIAAEKQQGLAVEVEGLQNSFTVCFSVLQGMAVTDDDPETVLIQVKLILLSPKGMPLSLSCLYMCRAMNCFVHSGCCFQFSINMLFIFIISNFSYSIFAYCNFCQNFLAELPLCIIQILFLT